MFHEERIQIERYKLLIYNFIALFIFSINSRFLSFLFLGQFWFNQFIPL